MKGVLVIEGHVQGLSNVRSLGEQGIPVWVLDKTKCLAQFSIYCKKFILCPDFNSDEFVPFLIQLAKKNNLKDWLILPSNDHAVNSIAQNRLQLAEHFKLITDKFETINRIQHKVEFLNLANKLQVPFPKFEILTDVPENLNLKFPVITKGNIGLNFHKKIKKKVVLSNNKSELEVNLKKIGHSFSLTDTFSQELIPYNQLNRTLSFTSFSVDGEIKTYWIGQKLREHPLRFGTAVLAESIKDPGVYQYAEKLIRALNYTGISEIEFLKDERDGEYKLIEMNARSWLWVGLAKECGVNYAKIAYDFTQENEINYPENYEKNVVWFNPITNFYYTLIGLATRQIRCSELNRNKGKKRINALLQKKDWKPFFAYFFLLFKFIKLR
jgi:predicted ATP-grasp superfamily ATP-dependent carboligase